MKLHERLSLLTDLLEENTSKTNSIYDIQTEGSVPKTELDESYQEGVNSIE